MNNQEAMKIIVNQEEAFGKIDDVKISISPGDIKNNIRCNSFEIDVEQIQDMCSIDENGVFEIYQGHSLSEVELEE